ncbi:hypothetical protein KI387_021947, partial [Taxus chinensis]
MWQLTKDMAMESVQQGKMIDVIFFSLQITTMQFEASNLANSLKALMIEDEAMNVDVATIMCPEKVQWPNKLGQPPTLYFNVGMFEPCKETYNALLQTLQITPPMPFAEQDFLNIFFQKIYKPTPLLYNLVLAMLWRHPENVELEKVKVVHYCTSGSKPWRYRGKEANKDREDVGKKVVGYLQRPVSGLQMEEHNSRRADS